MELNTVAEVADKAGPVVEWLSQNWIAVVLTGEIIGAVLAIKVGAWRRGLCWLAAALATIWIGGAAA